MSMRFLIVDDSDLSQKVITALLNKLSIKSDCVSSAAEAYELLQNAHYDMVLMDYMMPDVNGIEAVEYIRNLSISDSESTYFSELPIIIFTADDSFIAEIEKHGKISGYISKPVKNEELLKLIKNFFPDYNTESCEPAKQGKFVIDGIDADPSECIDYLEIFSETADTIAQSIKVALQMNDISMYTIEVHRIKGEARIISANELSEAALELELAGKALNKSYDNGLNEEENRSLIKEKTSLLLEKLSKLKRDIKAYKENNGLSSKLTSTNSAEPVIADTEQYNLSMKKHDKIVRYLNYAIESIDSGNPGNAREWLVGIVDLLS